MPYHLGKWFAPVLLLTGIFFCTQKRLLWLMVLMTRMSP